ncbi:Crp/Fnr family transcriptional regulator [Lacticaseibacillus thailandensis]|uniref:Crp/Fnr family transcriptional regulator n=1 Tax=Lacticaseibacillus thailandensis TaxID=381741 RepID=UPI0006D1C95C|nr:helix-turn-helix domain-containing protein [Lacticaseibacillus thailandensis]
MAIHEAHVLAISHDKIDQLVYNNRDFNHQLILSYQRNIDYLIRKKELLLTSTGWQRLAYYLTCYLDEYEPSDDTVHVSQSLMGSLVVLNPVNTSRNMKKLRQLGLISTDRNGIKVLQREKLRQLGEIEEITI